MGKHYDVVYLAPHLDDAVLSCGGQIYDRVQAGEAVLVVTVMAGDPPVDLMNAYIAELHERWDVAGDATAMRRAEDIAAINLLGADFAHWTVPDCIYRGNPAYYLGDEAIFGQVHPDELRLISLLQASLAKLDTDMVIAPMAAGNHVDHQLVRAAAEAHLGRAVFYYEDYPYVQNAGSLAAVLANGQDWCTQLVGVSPAGYQQKVQAIAQYRSQLSTFFTDQTDLEAQVFGYMNRVGGERLWHLK